MPLLKSSINITVPNSNSHLHLKRFHGSGDVIFMVHGVIENGRIFYSKSDKGLAPFLAKCGYDVFVLDLAGRGLSQPSINKHAKHGQTESITQSIPLALQKIKELRKDARQHWLAHSWGGVLMASTLARMPELITDVASQVYFGSKRQVKVRSLYRFFYIDFMWRGACKLLTNIYGYLPAKKYKIGADNETKKSHQQSIEWVKGDWIDSDDNFNYQAALVNQPLPPTLFLAAINDHALGHPDDVQRFLQECGTGIKRYQLLSKNTGNLVDYDHINMLTHHQAEKDIFPTVLNWIEKH